MIMQINDSHWLDELRVCVCVLERERERERERETRPRLMEDWLNSSNGFLQNLNDEEDSKENRASQDWMELSWARAWSSSGILWVGFNFPLFLIFLMDTACLCPGKSNASLITPCLTTTCLKAACSRTPYLITAGLRTGPLTAAYLSTTWTSSLEHCKSKLTPSILSKRSAIETSSACCSHERCFLQQCLFKLL